MADFVRDTLNKTPLVQGLNSAFGGGGGDGLSDEERYKRIRDAGLQNANMDPTTKALYDKSGLGSRFSVYGTDVNNITKSADVQGLLDYYNKVKQNQASQPSGLFQRQAFTNPYGNTVTDAYVGALQDRLKTLQSSEAMDKNRGDLSSALDTQVNDLQSQVSQHKDMLDQRLGDMLKEYGLTAAMQNQKIGAAYSDRGLNRSSFAQRAVEQNYANQQQAAGTARMATDQAKYGMQNQVDQIRTGIENEKSNLAQQKDIGNADAFQKYMADLHEQSLKQMYDNEAFMKQMDANQKNQMNQLLGGLVQSGATLAALL